MNVDKAIGEVFNAGFREGLKASRHPSEAMPERTIPSNVDLDAVRNIAADLENGEYRFWDEGWAQSACELIRLVIGDDRG